MPLPRELPLEVVLLPERRKGVWMPDDNDDVFADLPPSAKLVAKVIEHEGAMDAGEVSEAARLHPSTTRDALKRLAEEGVVDVHVGDDGGRFVYSMDERRNS